MAGNRITSLMLFLSASSMTSEMPWHVVLYWTQTNLLPQQQHDWVVRPDGQYHSRNHRWVATHAPMPWQSLDPHFELPAQDDTCHLILLLVTQNQQRMLRLITLTLCDCLLLRLSTNIRSKPRYSKPGNVQSLRLETSQLPFWVIQLGIGIAELLSSGLFNLRYTNILCEGTRKGSAWNDEWFVRKRRSKPWW